MTNELIKFPEPGETWKDTGEGGMYVYAVVPRPADFKDNCTVENSLVLTAPDYPVSDLRNFWGDTASAVQEERARNDAASLMDRQGYAAKASMVRSLVSLDSLSVDMLAAVYMGSTSRSLQDVTNDAFWEAAWEDLTPTGALLLDRLNIAFSTTPHLLTFLDT